MKQNEEKVFRKVNVKDRLPEKPKEILGGQQVNISRINHGIRKFCKVSGYDDAVGFCYSNKRWYQNWDCRNAPKYDNQDITDYVTHWLEELPLSELTPKEQGWISVKKGLPQKDTPVLVFQANKKKELEFFVCSYDGSNWREYEIHDSDITYEALTWYDEITHWMPLPKPPTKK